MANPFLTVYGPRPERWWAVCMICRQTSRPRFKSAEEAGEWEHDCHTPAEDDGKVTLTIEYTIDDAPKIRWDGTLNHERLKEMRYAVNDMSWWQRTPARIRTEESWEQAVYEGWSRRRERSDRAAIAAMEDALARPYVCPECGQRAKTVGGLKNHMRACYKVDPFALKRGEYDAAMVPGGLSQGPETTG